MHVNRIFRSPNFDERNKPIEYIIIHYTEMKFNDALQRLTDKNTKVSAHYLIKDDGELFQLVDDDKVAWHAGESYWQGQSKLNENSIGIELDSLGNDVFSQKQTLACLDLCQDLSQKYNIPPQNFIGHSDVAPERKIDPGIFFDWELFAKKGFGIWHDIKTKNNPTCLYRFGHQGSAIKSLQAKLSKIGYKIKPTAIFDPQTNYVIRAFQSKFYPQIIHNKGLNFYHSQDSLYEWDTHSNKILDAMVKIIS
jgi:N-acetylmuramoyl-L-alanine amidase